MTTDDVHEKSKFMILKSTAQIMEDCSTIRPKVIANLITEMKAYLSVPINAMMALPSMIPA